MASKPQPAPESPQPVQPGRDSNIPVPNPAIAKQRAAPRLAGPVAGLLALATVASAIGYLLRASGNETFAEEPETSTAVRAVYPDPSTLSLSGSRAGRSIEITWNASAPIFASARVGILGISDGAVNKEITLTSSQLHAQKLVYMPATTRVEAVLEVYASDGRISRESAMFVLPPADDPPPAAPARRTVVAETRTVMRTFEQGQTRKFVPPNSGRSAASERAVIIDAPPHIETAQTRLISNLPSPIASVAGPQLPDNIRIPRASGPATTQPPRALRQVRPTIPSNIGAMLSRTTEVAVRIHVDASGKVVAAEPLGSAGGLNRYLGAASAAAAKMWSFEPARHGDAKVPGTMILKFVFGPGK